MECPRLARGQQGRAVILMVLYCVWGFWFCVLDTDGQPGLSTQLPSQGDLLGGGLEARWCFISPSLGGGTVGGLQYGCGRPSDLCVCVCVCVYVWISRSYWLTGVWMYGCGFWGTRVLGTGRDSSVRLRWTSCSKHRLRVETCLIRERGGARDERGEE